MPQLPSPKFTDYSLSQQQQLTIQGTRLFLSSFHYFWLDEIGRRGALTEGGAVTLLLGALDLFRLQVYSYLKMGNSTGASPCLVTKLSRASSLASRHPILLMSPAGNDPLNQLYSARVSTRTLLFVGLLLYKFPHTPGRSSLWSTLIVARTPFCAHSGCTAPFCRIYVFLTYDWPI